MCRVVLLFSHFSVINNSDFDDHHDSPEREVNHNHFTHFSDVSDIKYQKWFQCYYVCPCLKRRGRPDFGVCIAFNLTSTNQL